LRTREPEGSGERGEGGAEATGAGGGEESGVGGRTSLWAREKSGKKLRIRKIKIQRGWLGRNIGLEKRLDTTGRGCKRKNSICSKVIHNLASQECTGKSIKNPAEWAGVLWKDFNKGLL
jgi:hypothetical protein